MRNSFLTISALLALTVNLHSQGIQWIAFDTSGNLLDPNAGSGTGPIDLAVPSGQARIFITRSLPAVNVSVNGAVGAVEIDGFSASAGLDAEGQNFGFGLFDSGGTETLNDDLGVFGLWDPQGFIELFFHSTGANLFSGTAQGQDGNYTGALTNGNTYQGVVRVVNNSGSVSMGSGSGPANAGFVLSGSGVDQRIFTGNIAGAPQIYDTLAFYFMNNTAGAVTLTVNVPEPSAFALAGLGLGAMLLRRRRNR